MRNRNLAALAILLLVAATRAGALDGVSAQYGSGQSSHLGRFGAEWNWQTKWSLRGWTLGGYWEATLGQWRNPAGNVADLGLNPVFRLSPALSGPYAEASIGFHYLSPRPSRGGTLFSTHFQFSDQIGVGTRFGESGRHDIGLRFEHLSNGGIDHPNPGINFLVVRYQYHLR